MTPLAIAVFVFIGLLLAWFLGEAIWQVWNAREDRIRAEAEERGWHEGFRAGSALDEKQRKLALRARVLGR